MNRTQNQKYWSNEDFKKNKLYWENQPKKHSLQIRNKNIRLLDSVLKEANVFYFLEGNTLNSIYRYGSLDPKDHDDDIGVFKKSQQKILALENILSSLGFEIIRSNEYMISILRENRYIDICLFKNRLFKIGYGKKLFPKKYYKSFVKFEYEGISFSVPNLTNQLLKIRYGNK